MIPGSTYLVRLDDVTPNRATVTAVIAAAGLDEAHDAAADMLDYAIVTDGALVPTIGERVWIERTGRSSGRRTITARQ